MKYDVRRILLQFPPYEQYLFCPSLSDEFVSTVLDEILPKITGLQLVRKLFLLKRRLVKWTPGSVEDVLAFAGNEAEQKHNQLVPTKTTTYAVWNQ
jgi:hypothetical protein